MLSAARRWRSGPTSCVGMQLEPPHLDPTAGAAAAIDEVVYANVFEGLTRFAPDGSILPALAESWEIAPDGLELGVPSARGRDLPRRRAAHRRGRGLLLRPGDGGGLDQRPEAALRRHQRGDGDRRLDASRSGSTRRRARCSSTSPGATRSSSRRRIGGRQHVEPGRHRAVQVRALGAGRPGRAGAQPRLLGRAAGAREGYLQVHRRPDRGASPR